MTGSWVGLFIVASQEPLYRVQKIHAKVGLEGGFELAFCIMGRAKVDKIINVDSNVDRERPGSRGPEKRQGA